MLIAVIILSGSLLFVIGLLVWHMYITRRAHIAGLDALFNACMESGIDLAQTGVVKEAQAALNRKFDLIEERNKALYEVRRQRNAIIDFMKFVREYQVSLDRAQGIHVRKDFVLEFLTGVADHFTMEKV